MKKKWMILAACAIGTLGIVVGASAANIVKSIKAELRPDFEVVIDGKKQSFKNVNGEEVYPILYDGTTYLPVRAIGELMGKTVYWYQDEKRIELKDEKGSLVTDADVIVDGDKKNKDNDKNNPGKDKNKTTLTLDEAKQIALKELGLKADAAEFIKAKLDKDDGVYEYDFEIKSGDRLYSIDVDANSGAVNDKESEMLQKDANDKPQSGDIGAESAKKAALDKAGFNESDVQRMKVEADYENGVKYYEVEFVKGTTEYNAEVRASDGAIIKWEKEKDD